MLLTRNRVENYDGIWISGDSDDKVRIISEEGFRGMRLRKLESRMSKDSEVI